MTSNSRALSLNALHLITKKRREALLFTAGLSGYFVVY